MVVGAIVTILDAVDDGFSVWNLIAMVCFAVVVLYGMAYLDNAASRRR
jgi:hypothetical protein